ncbi:TRAP transporter small permease [Salinicoccus halodurans]|uniref:C4-dicarboxylate ABC transporter permease n=1 Tax=Salinicoccus halodurans TaxID=407035 RepID=A0A0F7HLA3_9STAP|nr:TRAP transporter small permease [Salinicoccus halodurans]AKG74727.1 C4-dicarboxylate ABC transporter permease [Salinicoccus halodurans]SFK87993.1 TRAP-type C4-dicarboxylate transport system, small permease component [Salinicoccus halodurans]
MNKMIKAIEKVQIAAGILFLVMFFLATILQIITRYMGLSVLWTEELANYAFIWAIFMGAALMVSHREHFTFDMLKLKLSRKNNLYLNIFIDALLVVFNLYITIYGFQLLQHFWNYTWETVPAFKMGFVWLSVPVMSITMILYSVNHIINSIASLKKLDGKEISN